MRGEEAQTLKDFLSVLGGSGDEYKLKVVRESPKTWKGKSIEGWVADFYEPTYEDEIKQRFGGGVYIFEVNRRRGRGWEYFRRRKVKIAGDPIMLDHEDEPSKGGSNGHSPSIDDTIRLAERIASTSNDSARDSTQMFQMMIETMRMENEASNRRNEQLMRRLEEMQSSRGQPTMSDQLLQKVVTEDSHRFDVIREAHASEMRTLRELQRSELEEMRRNHREDLQRQSDQHQRELDRMRESAKDSKKGLEQAYEQRIESLKSDRERVMADLTEARAKVAALEAKKDKSLIEQMGEIGALKEAFKEFGGGSDEEGPQKWYESIANNAPAMLETVMERLRPPDQQQPPSPEQQQLQAAPAQAAIEQQARASAAALGILIDPSQPLPPVGQPFRMQDGNVYVRATATEFRMLSAEEVEAAERDARAPDAEDIQTAVRFLESAATNGQDPVTFAQGIRSFVSDDVVDWIVEEGVDSLLTRAKLEQSSILRQQKGRNFLRAAIEALKGD